MKILVTGGDGQLGANLVRVLIDRGHVVRTLVKPGHKAVALRGVPAEIVIGDVLDRTDMQFAVHGCDAVVHAAAMVRWWPRRSKTVDSANVEGTRNVVDAAERNEVERFIYVGSASSFRPGPLDHPAGEGAPECCDSRAPEYIRSKLTAQRIVMDEVRERRLPGIVVNPTFMIGPYGSLDGSSSLLLRLYRRQLRWIPPGGRNFVHTGDVAVGIEHALTKGLIGECYILGHENLPYSEAFRKICRVLRIPPPRGRISRPLMKTAGLLGSAVSLACARRPDLTPTMAEMTCRDCYYDPRKAMKELDMPQHPIEEAVEDAWRWFRSLGVA